MDEVEPYAHLELFRNFLVDDARMSKFREMSEAQSTELDLFRVLRVQDSELVHSNFLAWLLNPAGTHGIQEYFLRNFLERTVVSARNALGHIAECPVRIFSSLRPEVIFGRRIVAH